jgi:hypothetical protein
LSVAASAAPRSSVSAALLVCRRPDTRAKL